MVDFVLSFIWIAFSAFVLWGGISDLRTYRIPNLVSAGLVLLFVVAVVLSRRLEILGPHVAISAVVLMGTFGLFLASVLGAGDAKMLSAVALWAGPSAIVPLLGAVASAGLLLLVILLPVRCAYSAMSKGRPVSDAERPKLLRRHSGVPYGAAIALGALAASPFFIPQLGSP